MTDTQVSLIQIDNYGPWTVTPEPRPEPDLQALQADLYADLARLVGTRDGYVFAARFDNVVAVTNGVDRAAHARIQEAIDNRYPVSISVGVGRDPSPAAALSTATTALQSTGGAQEPDRTGELAWAVEDSADPGRVQLAHFDVVDATERFTDRLGAYPTFQRVERARSALMDHLYDAHGALTFFVGGDNFIAVCPDLDRAGYEETVETVADETDVALRVGVGRGATACEAGMSAKEALEDCREDDHLVAGDLPATAGR